MLAGPESADLGQKRRGKEGERIVFGSEQGRGRRIRQGVGNYPRHSQREGRGKRGRPLSRMRSRRILFERKEKKGGEQRKLLFPFPRGEIRRAHRRAGKTPKPVIHVAEEEKKKGRWSMKTGNAGGPRPVFC